MSQDTKLPQRIQKLGAHHALQGMPKNPWAEWTRDQIAIYDGSYAAARQLIDGTRPVTTPAGTPMPEPA